ncbi:MAG: FmdB family zinc ribbon protein [Anaerolineales bacterium]
MPLYSYRCDNCGVQIERRQGFNDPQLKKCPECGENELRKLYSPVGILFRGPGFYATDNRSASGTNGTSKKAEKSKTKEKSEAKTEKPESSEKKVSDKKD